MSSKLRLGDRVPHKLSLGLAGLISLAGLTGPVCAAEPVAMVEEVAGTSAGVNMMDYLATGTILHLGPSDNLVVDYFRSCVRETIKGGTVTIGIDRSTVSGGQLRSQTVDCDGGQLHLSATESGQAGVVAFRGLHAVPSRTLFGQSPVFELAGGAGKLVVDRMDKQAPRLEI